jgi:hypothetical protein
LTTGVPASGLGAFIWDRLLQDSTWDYSPTNYGSCNGLVNRFPSHQKSRTFSTTKAKEFRHCCKALDAFPLRVVNIVPVLHRLSPPPSVQKEVRQLLISGDINGVHLRLGVATFRIGRTHRLAVLALPSVLVRPDHGCSLSERQVHSSQISRHSFLAASAVTRRIPGNPTSSPDREVRSHLLRLAQASSRLLNAPQVQRPFEEWGDFHRSSANCLLATAS